MTSPAQTIRVLTVDDESHGREQLRHFLAQERDISHVGEAANEEEAVRRIRELRPDLVFLGVPLSGGTGFSVLERLEDQPPPAVVFVTAHDESALKVFDLHAVDYLLKPFGLDRFQTALRRAIDRPRSDDPEDWTRRLMAILAQLQPRPHPDEERIPVKSGGKVTFIHVAEVDWVGSADNYVELHVGSQTHLLRETLTAMEQRLPSERFIRISRTAIVNSERVQELQPLFHGEYSLTLRDGTRLTLSRTYRDRLPRLGVR
ncbi:MAG: response regulator transcription factor [Verrucomicrobiae bacterium]|nr:response regulator transcription factor [Verrucomicrobiae bacterium]